MRSFLQKWLICFSFLTFFGCATVTQTGGTVADATLRSDVMQMISKFEAAAGRSKQPVFVSARGVGRIGSTVVEHWIVGSDGTRITYEVSLTPSPGGGVDYRVRLQSSGSETPTRVTLKDGKTYEIETVRGLPVGFSNDQIRVRDLGITGIFAFVPVQSDAPSFVRVLVADLIVSGQFDVTVTTPLDSSASARLRATGPGKITLSFFPQAAYPRIWEGMDQPGAHWFPFHFVFEDKQSKKRFEFTQWARMDYETWKEMLDLNEKMKRDFLKK